jgi:nucleotide-binding universal stress UspA family protein
MSRDQAAGRVLLLAVDDTEAAEHSLDWTLQNLYRPGDVIHLVHVVPRQQLAQSFGAPPVDFLPQQDPVGHEMLLQHAETFIRERLLPKLADIQPDPCVHIVKSDVDTDSIGNVICNKADMLKAAAVIMASHNRSKLKEFFLGSVTNYCAHHCKQPVLIVP